MSIDSVVKYKTHTMVGPFALAFGGVYAFIGVIGLTMVLAAKPALQLLTFGKLTSSEIAELPSISENFLYSLR